MGWGWGGHDRGKGTCLVLRSGGKGSHQGEPSSYGRDSELKAGICGPGQRVMTIIPLGKNLDLYLSSLGFNGFSG